MNGGRLSRGHPLIALLAVLCGWLGGRVATWEAPSAVAFPAPGAEMAPGPGMDTAMGSGQGTGFVVDPRGGPASFPGAPDAYPPMPEPGGGGGASAYFRYPAFMAMPMRIPISGAMPPPGWTLPAYSNAPAPPSSPPHLRGEFAFAEPLPRFYAPEPPGMAAAAVTPAPPQKPRRWSADAWALLRRDSAGGIASPGALPATYGASQAGAVLRYRLALASRYRPAFYMRTTSTMGQMQETSAALGFSARPLPAFPVIAAVEARLTEQGGARRFQPAVMAVTELPPFRLPAGFRGEAYAQAGYVAGRFATPFADGQVRADRPLLRVGKVETRVGAGLWGGVQKGAARLDAGPSASVMMPLGRGTMGRVAVDWRFRLTGNAVPDSGPAVTLSAGF